MTEFKTLCGVGVGPANLGLACMIDELQDTCSRNIDAEFFELRSDIFWHERQLLPGSKMLSEYVWDLVTPVNPRSRYTFLNYLYETGYLEEFLVAGIMFPQRNEFQSYMRWAAANIDNISFSSKVESISFSKKDKLFELVVKQGNRDETHYSKHLALGAGKEPYIPEHIKISKNIFHVSNFTLHTKELKKNKHVLVVGSGQSAAECVEYLLTIMPNGSSIKWITKSPIFRDIDESSFRRQAFSDAGAQHFYNSSANIKEKLLELDKELVSGISPSLSAVILERAYYSTKFDNVSLNLAASCEVLKIVESNLNQLEVTFTEGDSKTMEYFNQVILCTGFKPSYLMTKKLLHDDIIDLIDTAVASRDYSYAITDSNSIFIQSSNFNSHGVSDNNLIMSPFRNKRILSTLDTTLVDQ